MYGAEAICARAARGCKPEYYTFTDATLSHPRPLLAAQVLYFFFEAYRLQGEEHQDEVRGYTCLLCTSIYIAALVRPAIGRLMINHRSINSKMVAPGLHV